MGFGSRCKMAIAVVLLMMPFAAAANLPLNQRVLVIYDPNVPDSLTVANHYVAARSIPTANLCAISPPETATPLAWPTYVSTVRTPVQNCLNTVGRSNILYLVLAYIRPFGLKGQNGTLYSLDGYLADIWDQYTNQNAFPYPDQPQPYYNAAQTQGNYYPAFVSLVNYRAQKNAATIYSVWRLDGATPALAEGLVDQALAAETNGLNGQACLDRQYGAMSGIYDFSYGSGEWDLHQAASFAGQAGFSVTEDSNPQEFGTAPAPLCLGAAMYSGWYKLDHYNDGFTWNTGAIGFHLDSLSAADPRAGTNWSANAIKKGITVTSGAMAEPFLDGLAHPDGVFLNLLQGANVGDAFLRNEMWLKWMILNIGDPLYTPFPGGKAPFNGPDPQDSLVLTPQFPVGAQPATGTVILASAAPPGGTAVNLHSSKPSIASVPASVTVPQGQISANFSITTSLVTTTQQVLITASGGINQTNTLGVVPLLGGISTNVASIIGGGRLTAAVVLDAGAPPHGTVVNLTSSNPSLAPVPPTIIVPGGTDKIIFTIQTGAVASNAGVTFTATLQGAKAVTSVTLAPALAAVSLASKSVIGGTPVGGTVSLPIAAYKGGVVVKLSSNNPAVASVASQITVTEGSKTGKFIVTTTSVSKLTQVVITASSGDSVKQVNLTVNPPAVKSLTLIPSEVVGGQNSTDTVTLNAAAPNGGSAVTLSSSNPGVAQVPPAVTIPSGTKTATFTITTSPVQTQTGVSITATYNGTQSKILTVNP